MCRIALYASSEGSRHLKEVWECFKLGSLNDFLLVNFRKGYRRHMHGWGYAYVFSSSNELGYSFYKTSLPISNTDKVDVPLNPEYLNWILMVLHSRLTFREPVDVVNSHPHYFHHPGKLSLWLAHNGSLRKELLVKELGMEALASSYSDSYFFTQLFGKNISSIGAGDLIDSVKMVIDKVVKSGVVETALNFVAIVVDEARKSVLGLAVNYVTEDYIGMLDYYTLYKVVLGGNSLVVASSTVALYLKKLYGFDVEPVDNKKIIAVYPHRERVEVRVSRI